jgi:hypothetical protein
MSSVGDVVIGLGSTVGGITSLTEGGSVGTSVKLSDGDSVGSSDGSTVLVGLVDGAILGSKSKFTGGTNTGATLGSSEGTAEVLNHSSVGSTDGSNVG